MLIKKPILDTYEKADVPAPLVRVGDPRQEQNQKYLDQERHGQDFEFGSSKKHLFVFTPRLSQYHTFENRHPNQLVCLTHGMSHVENRVLPPFRGSSWPVF